MLSYSCRHSESSQRGNVFAIRDFITHYLVIISSKKLESDEFIRLIKLCLGSLDPTSYQQ